MKNRNRIELLINNFEEGLLNENEFHELLDWYNSFDDSETIISGQELIESTDIKTRMYANILKKAEIPITTNPKEYIAKSYFYKWNSVAAAVVLLSIALWWGLQQHHNHKINQVTFKSELIQHGINKANLKLADGTIVELKDISGGLITEGYLKYSDGTSVLDSYSSKSITVNSWLELETPKGGTYQVTLADGTQVWLNAGSQLWYPAHFIPEEDRLVKVQGEAYFKVKQLFNSKGEKIPFRVKANRQVVEVLGTEFNISDYQQLKYTHTTLIEGKVSIENQGKSTLLKPNEQWIQLKTGSTLKKQVDTKSITAWKDNKFNFANKSFEEVFNEIGLWYNITIIYQGNIPDVELLGDAYRNSDFSLILRLLEVSKVDYILDAPNRKLIIK